MQHLTLKHVQHVEGQKKAGSWGGGMGRRGREGGRGHGGQLGFCSNYGRNHLEFGKRVLGSVSHSDSWYERIVWLLQREPPHTAHGSQPCWHQGPVSWKTVFP